MRRLAVLITLVLGVARIPTASAQGVIIPPSYDSIATDSMAEWYMRSPHPVPVCQMPMPREIMRPLHFFLRASSTDTSSAVAVQADLMAQNVSAQLSTLLGGTESKLPVLQSASAWSSVPAQLVVTLHEDGSVTRRGVSVSGDTSLTSLLVKAFDAARARGEAQFIFPDQLQSKTLVVRLQLEADELPHAAPSPGQHRFAAFQMPYPTMSPALPKGRNAPPRYPPNAAMRSVTAFVIMRFIVDTAGRAVPASIHDLWPTDKPPLTGDLARYYEGFVKTVTETLPSWQFTPARVGPCPLRQIVELPIAFESGGYR
jgi:hypothetical protein